MAVPLERATLDHAAHEHQGDEDGERVGEARVARAEERDERSREREEQAHRDREIEVEHPTTQAFPRGAEEGRSADRDRRDGEHHLERRDGRAQGLLVEPEVLRDPEHHRVHRQRDGHARAHDERVVRSLGVLSRRPHEVAETLDALDEVNDVEALARDDLAAAQRGVHEDAVAALFSPEQLLEHPDAARAVHPLHVELEATDTVGARDRLGDGPEPEPIAARLVDERRPHARAVAEHVVAIERRRPQEARDRAAAVAAVRVGRRAQRLSTVRTARRRRAVRWLEVGHGRGPVHDADQT